MLSVDELRRPSHRSISGRLAATESGSSSASGGMLGSRATSLVFRDNDAQVNEIPLRVAFVPNATPVRQNLVVLASHGPNFAIPPAPMKRDYVVLGSDR